ncbi:MAG: ABC transporter permease [Hymenobacter sp.]|nr:MAG: ABC transporter permease [Hymenobacter sp.]
MSQLAGRAASLSAWLSVGWLLAILFTGLLAPWLPLPFAPGVPDLLHVAEPPSWVVAPRHWLGTDPLGRDVLAELVYGAQQLVSFSLPAAGLATLVGALAGGAAGFWGNRGLRLPLASWLLGLAAGWWLLLLPGGNPVVLALLGAAGVAWWARSFPPLTRYFAWAVPLDGLFQTLLVLLGAVPRLVLVLTLAAGPPLSYGWFLLLLVVVAWPEPARQVRAQMLRVRRLPFIEAAQAAGLPSSRVWLRHALPHACLPLRATAPLSLAGLISLESTLTFLGVGRPPDVASWGRLLGMLRQEPGAWWLLASAGGVLLLTLLSLQRLAQQPERKF